MPHIAQRGRSLFTCEGLDARALEQPGGAVVVVELLVGEVEAGVDVAVLLRDLHVVEVRGGRHGGSQGGERFGGVLRGLRWWSERKEGWSLNVLKQTNTHTSASIFFIYLCVIVFFVFV